MTTVDETTFQIREGGPGDLATEVEIFNSASPPDHQMTLERAKMWQSLERPENRSLRLLAILGDRPVGAGRAGQHEFGAHGRFGVRIATHPDFQRRGIAHALYDRLLAFAREAGAEELECTVRETMLSPVKSWLEREDFREVSRMRESELLLDRFDFSAHAAAEQRVEAEGIALTTLAEDDTGENRRKLLEILNLTTLDVPFDTPPEPESFEHFQQMLDLPFCLRDCLVMARLDDEIVGFTVVSERDEGRAFTMMTGVHPEHRSRGIAMAVKVRCARLVAERGYTSMRTYNHVNNPAMLAVNTRMGYVPLPESITFVKTL